MHEIAATSLYIERVDVLNQGIYQCKGENKTSETFYARGELQILGMIVQTNCDNDRSMSLQDPRISSDKVPKHKMANIQVQTNKVGRTRGHSLPIYRCHSAE